jgi:ribosomal protein S18 acetylase RimI-like enzyme
VPHRQGTAAQRHGQGAEKRAARAVHAPRKIDDSDHAHSPPCPSDAFAFQALRLSALRDSPTAFTSSYEEECDTPACAIEERLATGPGRYIVGAFAGAELVGIVGLVRETPLKLQHKTSIRGVYVAPVQRGMGLGRQLMEHAIVFAESMDGVRQVTLAVTASNTAAVALYTALGFRTFGHEPGALLVDGVLYDELQMVRLLRTS